MNIRGLFYPYSMVKPKISDIDMDNSMLNKIIIAGVKPFITFFDSYDMVENQVSGSGAVVQQLSFAVVRTGTTAGSYARLNLNSMVPTTLTLPTSVLLFLMYTAEISGDTLGFMGLSDTKYAGITSKDQTNKHAGIWYDNGSWFFSTGDGTNQQTTDITSYIGSSNDIAITRESDGNIRLYLSGVLRATHTTIGYLGYFQEYVHNRDTTVNATLIMYYVIKKG